MFPSHDILRVTLQGGLLLLTFLGAGLYLRGFWIYFRTVRWLHARERADIRRRYRSSAIAALLREPVLTDARRQFVQAILGLPLFILGGAGFNVLQRLSGH